MTSFPDRVSPCCLSPIRIRAVIDEVDSRTTHYVHDCLACGADDVNSITLPQAIRKLASAIERLENRT